MGKREDARERLLEAAVQEFAANGYAAANLEAIANASGVTRGPLYYYFGNKAGLYRETIAYEIEKHRLRYAEILREDVPVRDVIREDLLYCLADHTLFSRIGESDEEPDCSDLLREFRVWLIQRKHDVFSAARTRGELSRDCDVGSLITFIYVWYNGVTGARRTMEGLPKAYYDQRMLEDGVSEFMEILEQRFL